MSDADPGLRLLLDRLTIRSDLPQEVREAMLALPTRSTWVRANHDFIRLGQTVDSSSLIVEGVMGRFEEAGDAIRQITALYIPGDLTNVQTIIRPSEPVAIQALSNTRLLSIAHSHLRRLAAQFPSILEALWRDSAVDAAILSQWIVNVGRRNAQTRIAHFLCEMATRYGGVQAPSFIYGFPITQTHLADVVGLTAVHTNRILKQLREQGLARFRDFRVEIHDWHALVALGQFDPTYLEVDTRRRPVQILAALAE